jgi:transcriptional regulator with XRE-family HTH domain
MNHDDLGSLIAAYRERRRLTAEAFARELATALHMDKPFPRQTIFRWEHGERQPDSTIRGFIRWYVTERP